MSFTDYCSTGQNLYEALAAMNMNLKTGGPPENYDTEKHKVCLAELERHIDSCAQCLTEDSKIV
jgi:hypothetical protein